MTNIRAMRGSPVVSTTFRPSVAGRTPADGRAIDGRRTGYLPGVGGRRFRDGRGVRCVESATNSCSERRYARNDKGECRTRRVPLRSRTAQVYGKPTASEVGSVLRAAVRQADCVRSRRGMLQADCVRNRRRVRAVYGWPIESTKIII